MQGGWAADLSGVDRHPARLRLGDDVWSKAVRAQDGGIRSDFPTNADCSGV